MRIEGLDKRRYWKAVSLASSARAQCFLADLRRH
jgi:hypothetical protein